jgi:hypothetical protein
VASAKDVVGEGERKAAGSMVGRVVAAVGCAEGLREVRGRVPWEATAGLSLREEEDARSACPVGTTEWRRQIE